MAKGPKTRWIDWAVCVGVALVGLFFLVGHWFVTVHGTTPEKELKVVTGVPELVNASTASGVMTLRFKVGPCTVEYSSNRKGFDKVCAAIEHGQEISIGASMKRETLIPHPDWQPLYTLAVGNETILTYEHTIHSGYRESNGSLIVGLVVLGIAGYGLSTCIRNRNATPLSREEVIEKWSAPDLKKKQAFSIAGLIYLALMSAVCAGDSQAIFQMVFGDRPLGLPLALFTGVLFSILFLPVWLAAWHAYRIAYLKYHGEWSGIHRDVKRSQLIINAVILFYVLLMVAWIWYAEANDIRLPPQ